MSNKRYNNNRKKREAYHKFQSSPGEYCDALVADYFAFGEGRYSDMKLISPPFEKINDKPSESVLLALHQTCEKKWNFYCSWYKLPNECRKLFNDKVIMQWKEKGKDKKSLKD